jgi:integrase
VSVHSARSRTPSYRKHRASGQAVVTLSGRDHYLGKFGTADSRSAYDRVVSEWLEAGRRPLASVRSSTRGDGAGTDFTVAEVVARYVDHVDRYYAHPDGPKSGEPENIRRALKPLVKLYAATPATDFGPLSLKVVRQRMVDDSVATAAAFEEQAAADATNRSAKQDGDGDAKKKPQRPRRWKPGLCRTEINKRIKHVVRCFRWAATNELVPVTVPQALAMVPGLRRGKTEVKETAAVKPVPIADVEAILPHVRPQVAAMIRLQLLSGMRSGEVVIMRTCDIDRSTEDWVYRPSSHKTEHHGYVREVEIGPRAREVLLPWLKADTQAFLFSPREAIEAFQAEKRAARKTPVQPSQVCRKKRRPKRVPRDRYSTGSYGKAVARGCVEADSPHWHPHQLRHTFGTLARKVRGPDAARALLGHKSLVATQIYAEKDQAAAREVIREIG